MDFLKGVFSFCHSIRTGCHSGRVKGFERCFEFVNRLKLSRRQHDHRPAILQVLRTQNKLYEPHLGNAKSLRGTIEPHLGNEKPVKGIIKPHLGITKPNVGYDMPCLRNGFGRRYMYFTTHVKTSITRQTCAKAVAILYRGEKPRTSILHDNYYLSIAMNRSLHTVVRFDVGVSIVGIAPSFREFHEHSPLKHSKSVKEVKRRRDREPSRIPVKKIINTMKKRKVRCKLKFILKKYTPKSSRLYSFATDFKLWYVRYLHRFNCFFTHFAAFNRLTTKKLSQKRKQTSCCCSHKIQNLTCVTKRYSVSRINLLRSGDVELNPGPDQNVDNQTRLSVDSTTLLNFRLGQLGLRALDVGGAGDCFFRAVSHQLYGNPNSHFRIRQAAVHYLRHNPERFIESNTQNSWNGYLTIMSMQGTWCDALTVQAVAESLNIQIYIIESNVNFGQVTLIQPHHPSQQQPRTIYIGHVDEIHYVSTVPNSSCSGNEHCNNKYYNINNFTKQNVLSEQVQNSSRKRKYNSDLKNIRISTESSENNEKQSSVTKQNKTNEQKKKWNSYMRNYRHIRRANKKIKGIKETMKRTKGVTHFCKPLYYQNNLIMKT